MLKSLFMKDFGLGQLYFLPLVTLFALWIILSGYFQQFFVYCGIFSSMFVFFISKRLVDVTDPFKQILNSKLSFCKLVSYIPWLTYQIVLSSIYTTKKILQKTQPEPVMISQECNHHNDLSITLFANSVTITPGTLIVNVEDKQRRYLSTICLIDKELKDGVFTIEGKVQKIFN